ncbi:integrase, catalytic region, zinc finger, CCHC-type containing protein [Tanacetum coccineum]
MLGKKPNKVYDPFLKVGLGYKNPGHLKKAIAAQQKMYDGEMLHSAKLNIDSPDLEETLEDAEEIRLKMRNKMVQLNYGKLNALYETFVPQQDFSVEQTYFSIPSTSNNGSESKEVTSDLPIPKMPKEKFYKTDVILMSASLLKNLKELKEELIEEKNKLLKAELEKSSNDSKDIQANLLKQIKILENDFKRSQAQSINFELKLQHQKEKMACDVSWKSKLSSVNDANVLLKTQVDSVVKERENIKLEYQKLFNSIKATQTQHQKELDELIEHVNQKTYAYADVRAKNQNLLITIFKLKNKLQTVNKGNNVNTKFDKFETSRTLLCVESSNSVRRQKSKSTKSNDRVLKNKSDKRPYAHVRKMSSSLVLWTVDSGCSKHMTGNLQLLRNFVEKFMGIVHFRNDHFAAITGYGDYVQGNHTICHVYYVEGLACEQGKSKKASFLPKLVPSTESKLELLHMDLCGPMRVTSSPEVLDNSAANTLDNDNTSSSSSIVVEEDEAPQIVYSSAKQVATEPNSLVLNENANEFVQEDVADFDGNVFYNAPSIPVFEEAESSSTYQDPSNMHEFHRKHRSSDKWTKNHPIEQVIGDSSKPIMIRNRLQTDEEVCMYALIVSTIEPKNIKEAMLDASWIESINIITVKWIWKNKTDAENTIIWNKSRLVAKGYGQEEGIDFEESFALQDLKLLQVHQSPRGICICQSQYTMDLFKKHRMEKCDTISTPMATVKLDADLQVFHMAQQSIPCSPECKIVGQILLDHPLSYALTATADVPIVYLQQFWQTVHKKFLDIPQRVDEDYHSIKDDTLLEIRATDDFKEYETVFVGVDVPMNQPQPVVSTQGTHRSTPRAHRTPTISTASPQGKKRKQTTGESSSPQKSLKITIRQKQVVEGEKDDDDSEDRLEPKSHNENPEYVDDDGDEDKVDEEKDVDTGSLETRTEEMQTPNSTPPRSLRINLSSDKNITLELTDIDVQTSRVYDSEHGTKVRYNWKTHNKADRVLHEIVPQLVEKATYDLIENNLKPSIAATIIEDRDAFRSAVHDLVRSIPFAWEKYTTLLGRSIPFAWEKYTTLLGRSIPLCLENKENGRMILNSVLNGPLVWPAIVQENGTTRIKKYEELSVAEKLQADCDLKATNIVLQGLPPDVYAIVNHHKVSKEIWDRVKLLMQGTKLSLQEKECKLYDEFDKFSFVKGETLYECYWRFAQLINNMNVINMTMRPVQVNTNLVVLVFTQGDDPIACLNKEMAFLSAVAASRYGYCKNHKKMVESGQTRTRERKESTRAGRMLPRVTVQQVQGKQGHSYVDTGYKGNATSSGGNNAGGQARVVKCYNCQGEGHMARKCTQPKRPRNAAWFKEKEMLAEVQESGQILDEKQLAFLADPGIPDGQAA